MGVLVNELYIGQDPVLVRLAAMIHEYCGIDYSDNLSSLALKVGQRITGLGMSLWEYADYLRGTSGEWDLLIEHITINETYFFREESQLQELVTRVLPHFAAQPVIRVWSAAGSTGEEAYSIAMSILESGVVPLSKIEIYATDINKKVLRMAKEAFYPKQSMCFRRTTEEMKRKYFIAEEKGYRVKEFIRERVQFYPYNLTKVEQSDTAIPTVDVIFCRNVLIYFDAPTVRSVVQHLSSKLADGGYLFLGHAETVSGMVPGLRTVNAPSTFYYRREGREV